MKFHIPPQDIDFEVANIITRSLIRLCAKNNLIKEVLEILDNANITYEIREANNVSKV